MRTAKRQHSFAPLYCATCNDEIKAGTDYQPMRPGFERCIGCPPPPLRLVKQSASTHWKLKNKKSWWRQ